MAVKASSMLLLSGCRRGGAIGGAMKMPGQVCGLGCCVALSRH